MSTLIDAEPVSQKQVAKGDWMFQFGEGRIGTTCRVAYAYRQNPRSVVYNVVGQYGKAVFEVVSERPLTDEELKHFRRKIKIMQHMIGDQEQRGAI